MKELTCCVDFGILKEHFDENTLKKIDKILTHFVEYSIENDDGEKDIIGEYTSRFGYGYVIDWYEGMITTEEFIGILKEGYLLGEVYFDDCE